MHPWLLPKNNPRYIAWHKSLLKRPAPWNKGKTKLTDAGVKKISETFKESGIDNFAEWRAQHKKEYAAISHDADLAELTGVVLGDGHIEKFPRTERLIIVSNSANYGFINRYRRIVERLFHKKPVCLKVTSANAVRISIYEKGISKRLQIPTGSRKKLEYKIPSWIWQNDQFLLRFLRGLYEAEGCFCVHLPTSTYKMIFTNMNPFLLDAVFQGLVRFGFHPHTGWNKIQVSRKQEVMDLKKLLQFRDYNLNAYLGG
ncbi:MAG: hypothetical protein A3A33_02465 [Candidatus Yanofskybacteria bacterium RIFCSPLOWO2_01_FULL_49_25]|uniref:DOD-type homing endonuclease domain-containing protein n=1 Tax=Candidatus Yanofskybacteria bacterium RIFCSPLOWO2_01_FULL_49_25 TaxID=1802701 RepID=A0A1F8GS09_9BACT|nr:MAG: hypothetical protein A3A33_02465 [Candidatus Yanofskybacteria bacterium RIFCSPLOWO2_01_FULL_49_25]